MSLPAARKKQDKKSGETWTGRRVRRAQPRGDAEEGTGHATTGRLVARGGDKRANTILPLTYVTGSHNNFTQPRGTRQDVERAFPGSSSSVSRKKIYFRGFVDRKLSVERKLSVRKLERCIRAVWSLYHRQGDDILQSKYTTAEMFGFIRFKRRE